MKEAKLQHCPVQSYPIDDWKESLSLKSASVSVVGLHMVDIY